MFCNTVPQVELDIRPSALKHGIIGESIAHAVTFPLLVDDEFEEGSDKVLVLGPDPAGNVHEVIGIFNEGTFKSSMPCPHEQATYNVLTERRTNEKDHEI